MTNTPGCRASLRALPTDGHCYVSKKSYLFHHRVIAVTCEKIYFRFSISQNRWKVYTKFVAGKFSPCERILMLYFAAQL